MVMKHVDAVVPAAQVQGAVDTDLTVREATHVRVTTVFIGR